MNLSSCVRFLVVLGCFSVMGCNSVTIDPSKNAISANDYTLVNTLNDAAPGGGLDILRRTQGAAIDSNWTLVLPQGHEGGEADVRAFDEPKSYSILKGDTQLVIPLKDLFNHATWEPTDSGTILAMVSLKYKTSTGLAEAKARGLGFIVILTPDYTPLPIDGGGYAASVTDCKITYSTAGRSSVSCK